MAHYCEDCGTKFSNGLCPNCHEEAFIMETQGDYLPPLSDEFKDKVARQLIEAEKQTSR